LSIGQFITSPVREWVIPSGNSVTVYVWVQVDGAEAHYWYGYTNASLTQNTHVTFNFLHIDFLNSRGTGTLAAYPCRDIGLQESFLLRARWDNDNTKFQWAFDETDADTWLFEDDIIEPIDDMEDGYFQLGADAIGAEKLVIYNFIVQEAWM